MQPLKTKPFIINRLNGLIGPLSAEEVDNLVAKIYIADITTDPAQLDRIIKEIYESRLDEACPETYEYVTDYIMVTARNMEASNNQFK